MPRRSRCRARFQLRPRHPGGVPGAVGRWHHDVGLAVERRRAGADGGGVDAPRHHRVRHDVGRHAHGALGQRLGHHGLEPAPTVGVGGQRGLVGGTGAHHAHGCGGRRLRHLGEHRREGARGAAGVVPEPVEHPEVLVGDPGHVLVRRGRGDDRHRAHQLRVSRGESERHPAAGRPADGGDVVDAEGRQRRRRVVGVAGDRGGRALGQRARRPVTGAVDADQPHPRLGGGGGPGIEQPRTRCRVQHHDGATAGVAGLGDGEGAPVGQRDAVLDHAGRGGREGLGRDVAHDAIVDVSG